ncbi:hypothetical protein ACHAO7_008126 [Fusarium culmorum]
MSQSTTTKPSANKGEYCFIRQVYLRGHLAPAFPPPAKQCTRCRKSFQNVRTMCLPCLRAISFEKECDARDRKRDTFLDDCEKCEKTTLHLGPDWCTACYAVPDDTFPVYCEECVVQNDVPNRVMDDKGLEALKCEFFVPDDNTPELSRWSDTEISRPSLVVTPKTESDIQEAVRIAKDNKLTVLAAGGGHGTFVSVDSSTLYLDLKNFKTIDLNKDEGRVRVGGGVVVGEMVKALADAGYYTPLPSSDAVGFVGCVLGGGSGILSGLHGWMIDNAVSFRVITAKGDIAEVSSESEGEDLALFNAFCGAGHGLGVVTEVIVSAFPITKLNMEDDKIWTRTLVFPASAIDVAVEAFLDLHKPLPEGYVTMVFTRSPPGTPGAGAPIIVLGYTFFGPAEKGQKEAALLFQDNVVGRAVVNRTDLVPFASINAKHEAYNYHGGHKAIASCRLYKTDPEAIKSTFEKWTAATQEYPDAQQSPLILSASNTDKSMAAAGDNFIDARDRPLVALAIVIAKEKETSQAFVGVLDGIVAGLRKIDEGAGPRSFANNWKFETDVNEMFSESMFERLRVVKKTWDKESVFWSPYFK